MPSRMLRDWTDSVMINSVSCNAECLFIRLMMKADDFGNFHANTKLVKALCFPLKDYRETDVSRWMDELQESGLIAFYEAGNKKFLTILNFGQRLRNMRNSFPQPTRGELLQVAASCGELPPEEKRREEEIEEEEEGEQPGGPKSYDKFFSELPEDYTLRWEPLLNWFKEHKPKFFKPYLDLWNVFAVLNKIIVRDQLPIDKRKGKFKIRVKEPGFNFTSILGKIKESDFLKGENERKWKVDIDFILDSENNYIKILEGKYDNNK